MSVNNPDIKGMSFNPPEKLNMTQHNFKMEPDDLSSGVTPMEHLPYDQGEQFSSFNKDISMSNQKPNEVQQEEDLDDINEEGERQDEESE